MSVNGQRLTKTTNMWLKYNNTNQLNIPNQQSISRIVVNMVRNVFRVSCIYGFVIEYVGLHGLLTGLTIQLNEYS